MLLLPHHYEFAETLANLPFFYKEMSSHTCEILHVIQSDPNHLPEIANTRRLQEYLQGGEVDEFVEYVDGYADEPIEENDDGLITWELGDEWLGAI